jgi:predicted nucleic acid-binding protein
LKLYVESSAVVAWFMGEVEGPRVKALLNSAELVTTSDLTLIECDRVLIRAVALGETNETEAATRRGYLTAAAAVWTVLQIGRETVERARRPFPVEPIRSLDAIHLASALTARAALPTLEILSLDDRIRNAALQLGFKLQPR